MICFSSKEASKYFLNKLEKRQNKKEKLGKVWQVDISVLV